MVIQNHIEQWVPGGEVADSEVGSKNSSDTINASCCWSPTILSRTIIFHNSYSSLLLLIREKVKI